MGITCALCHSTVDDSVQPGIGHRLDGRPNLTLNPGAIIALSPALDAAKKAVYSSWGAGKYDPRFNQDGKNAPVVIPPAFGLAGVKQATYTGDGDISYWNNYVAVTQMGGHGAFKEPRLGIDVAAEGRGPREVRSCPRCGRTSTAWPSPRPPAGSFDAAAAKRGPGGVRRRGASARAATRARRSPTRSSTRPRRPGWMPAYAARSATKKYRTTPLRALWQHAPYFHDGKAANLPRWWITTTRPLKLNLTAEQKKDLVEYLKSI